MRRVQDHAVALFERRGFAAVRVEEIARAAKVGVASIYRNFGTKENLVLWDEYDPLLVAELKVELQRCPPLEALRHSVGRALARIYDTDKWRILRRADLVTKNPALSAASQTNVESLRLMLEKALRRAVRDAFEREVLCAVFTATLVVAIERWRKARGKVELGELLERALSFVEETSSARLR